MKTISYVLRDLVKYLNKKHYIAFCIVTFSAVFFNLLDYFSMISLSLYISLAFSINRESNFLFKLLEKFAPEYFLADNMIYLGGFLIVSALFLFCFFYEFIHNAITFLFYNKVVSKIQAKFMEVSLKMDYLKIIKIGTKDLDLIKSKESAIHSFVLNFTNLIFDSILFLIFLYSFFKINLLIALIFFGTSLIFYYIIFKIFKRYLDRKHVQLLKHRGEFYDFNSRTLFNLKLLKLRKDIDTIPVAFEHFSIKESSLLNSINFAQKITGKFLYTFFFIALLSFIFALALRYGSNVLDVAGKVSFLTLIAYRLIPLIQKLLHNITSVYNDSINLSHFLKFIDENLNPELSNYKIRDIKFERNIKLENFSFSYIKERPIFKAQNITINKGDRVGVIGKTGAGKTTLIDIIIGIYLLKGDGESEGRLIVDDKILLSKDNMFSWRQKIEYIPQGGFFIPGTLAKNISFDTKIDEEKIIKCLESVQLWDIFKDREGIYTHLNNASLSGGQVQRLTIARALYKEAEIIVLDEPTSALDPETETFVINTLNTYFKKDVTILMISHKNTTLKYCNRIFKVEKGKVLELSQDERDEYIKRGPLE